MDVLVWAATKGAAKCDKHCELQNSVNQQTPERIRHLRVFSQVGLVQCLYVFLANPRLVVMAQHWLLGAASCDRSLLACGNMRVLVSRCCASLASACFPMSSMQPDQITR